MSCPLRFVVVAPILILEPSRKQRPLSQPLLCIAAESQEARQLLSLLRRSLEYRFATRSRALKSVFNFNAVSFAILQRRRAVLCWVSERTARLVATRARIPQIAIIGQTLSLRAGQAQTLF